VPLHAAVVHGVIVGVQCVDRYASYADSVGHIAHNEQALRFYRGVGFTDIGGAREHVRLNGAFYDEVFLERAI
jgi:hypothetical protein